MSLYLHTTLAELQLQSYKNLHLNVQEYPQKTAVYDVYLSHVDGTETYHTP